MLRPNEYKAVFEILQSAADSSARLVDCVIESVVRHPDHTEREVRMLEILRDSIKGQFEDTRGIQVDTGNVVMN